MDFDDLLWNAVKVFDRDEAILLEYQNRFRYIMVDEYQDTNKTQYKFVKMLAEGSGNICVVGDDDQCIYQWRGADISNILDFEKDFPGAKVIKLEQNYRSTGNILAAAHSVIENNTHRKSKKLWTDADDGSKIVYHRADNEKEEAYYVAQEINRLCTTDRKWNDFAVLYRTNAQSRNFEEALSARDIPYRVVGGVRYYDRKEIKDIVAYMYKALYRAYRPEVFDEVIGQDHIVRILKNQISQGTVSHARIYSADDRGPRLGRQVAALGHGSRQYRLL